MGAGHGDDTVRGAERTVDGGIGRHPRQACRAGLTSGLHPSQVMFFMPAGREILTESSRMNGLQRHMTAAHHFVVIPLRRY